MCFDPALKEYQCSEGETQVELVTTWYSAQELEQAPGTETSWVSALGEPLLKEAK